MPTQPTPHNLPQLTQALHGRQGELQQAWELLQKQRLVTLVGPAGVGKTFLALHLAQAHLQDFPGGVFYTSLGTERQALNAIARAVSAEDTLRQTLTESVCARLEEGPSLLVLDDAAPIHQLQQVLAPLLEGAPSLHVLVSADELLYLPGEQILMIAPLPLPQPPKDTPAETLLEYVQRIPAASMFVQLAQAAQPSFRLEAAQAGHVIALCSLVGGLPLGLQVAAAQCRYLPLDKITSGLQAVRSRTSHAGDEQNLKDVLDWSVGLLDASTQNLLDELAVFSGSFSPEAAQQVCLAERAGPQKVQTGLGSLLSYALLQEEPPTNTGQERYSLPTAVQSYALERLRKAGRAAILRHQHAIFYADLAEKAEAGLKGPEQTRFLALLETEYPNLRAAIRWATRADQAELALRLNGALSRFWLIRSYFREGLTCLDPALELAHNATDIVSAKAYNSAGAIASSLGNYDGARIYFHQALARARMAKNQEMTARVLNNLGIVAGDRAEYGQASRFFSEALALQREIGDLWGICNVQMNLGIVENQRGEHALARQYFEECLVFSKQVGVQNLIALNLHNLGEALVNLGELELAQSNFQESQRIARELEDQETTANALSGLGKVAFYQGKLDEALRFFDECVLLFNSIGQQAGLAGARHWQGAAYCAQGDEAAASQALMDSLNRSSTLGLRKEICHTLICLAKLASLHGMPERAARLLGAVERLRQEIEFTFGLPEQEQQRRIQEEVRSQMDAAAWQAAWEEGLALTFKQTLALGQRALNAKTD